MERYFMSISESAQLIVQAGSMGEGGEIFVLDMGSPVNIKEIAYELIRLNGLEPEKDIFVEYIGARPGEKLFEELATDEETIVRTPHEKIMMMKSEKKENWHDVYSEASNIIEAAKSYNIKVISQEIGKYVSGYKFSHNYKKEIKKIIK